MMTPRWRKVLRDIAGNKMRSVLVVLSIAVGICAVGMVVGLQAVLSHDLAASYAAGNPASAILYTEPFDEGLLHSVARMGSVQDVEGRRIVNVRLKVGQKQWRRLQLVAIPDYEDIRLNIVRPEDGMWPPPEREVLIERSALADARAKVGDVLLIETPDGTRRELPIAGTAHDNTYLGPLFTGGIIRGFVTFETLSWLGQPQNFNQLHLVVTEEANEANKANNNKEQIAGVADQVADKVDKSGLTIWSKTIFTPGEHPATFLLNAMIVLLGALGLLCLLLSAFLVVNTLSALLMQHGRQIGIMKAIGARTGQLMAMYLVLTLIFGLLALLVAIPLAGLGTRAMALYVATLINFNLGAFNVPPQMILIQLLIAVVTPVVAAFYPVLTGTRVTVREAIMPHASMSSNIGIAKEQSGSTFLDHLFALGSRAGLSRPLLLSLRNTFRRQGRLALTLMTLTLGGTIFISVLTVQDSLVLARDDLMTYYLADVNVTFKHPYRAQRIEQEAKSVPGVARIECWNAIPVRRIRPDGGESNDVVLNSVDSDSDLIQPILLEGRWLRPEDDNAVVIGSDLLRVEPDIRVGDDIVLKIEGRESSWHVIGSVLVLGNDSTAKAYANNSYVTRVAGRVGRAKHLKIVTTEHNGTFQANTAKALEDRFKEAGLNIFSTRTYAQHYNAL
ncbi:MAG: ABC transporter permease [Ardenticatenaceae bacterium]